MINPLLTDALSSSFVSAEFQELKPLLDVVELIERAGLEFPDDDKDLASSQSHLNSAHPFHWSLSTPDRYIATDIAAKLITNIAKHEIIN